MNNMAKLNIINKNSIGLVNVQKRSHGSDCSRERVIGKNSGSALLNMSARFLRENSCSICMILVDWVFSGGQRKRMAWHR